MYHDPVIVFYDSSNTIWRGGVEFVKRLDRKHCLHFANIAARGFDPRIYDKTQLELAAQPQGLLPDGTWINGVELIRHVYTSIGFCPLVALTELPIFRQLSELSFQFLARMTQRRHT